MKTTFKRLAAAAVVAMASSTAALAVTITGGIDIGGRVTTASAKSLDYVNFIGGGDVVATAGDFDAVAGLPVTLMDIDFTVPDAIYTVGAFTFTATSYSTVEANKRNGKDFTAYGYFSAAGFDDTAGTFQFSSQSSRVLASFSSSSIAAEIPVPAAGFLLISAVVGVGGISARRRKAA